MVCIRKSSYRRYFLGSSSPTKQWELCGIRAFPKQNQNSGLREAGVFFQKMKNDITLRGDTSSQLDFNLAPQDIVLNCSDGQVRSIFVACQLNWNFCIKGGDELTFVGSHLALHTTTFAGIQLHNVVLFFDNDNEKYCGVIFFIDRIRRVGQVGQMENAGKLFWSSKNDEIPRSRTLEIKENLQVLCGPELHLCARTWQERGRLLLAEFDQGRPGCLCRRGSTKSILSASAGFCERDNS